MRRKVDDDRQVPGHTYTGRFFGWSSIVVRDLGCHSQPLLQEGGQLRRSVQGPEIRIFNGLKTNLSRGSKFRTLEKPASFLLWRRNWLGETGRLLAHCRKNGRSHFEQFGPSASGVTQRRLFHLTAPSSLAGLATSFRVASKRDSRIQ